MTEIVSPARWDDERYSTGTGARRLTIFLGGSIDTGEADDWQARVVAEMGAFADRVLLLNPRRSGGEWKPEWLDEQIKWELHAQEKADVLIYYLAEGSKSPVTLLEIGTFATRASDSTIVCCAPGYFRAANVRAVCDLFTVDTCETLAEMISWVKKEIVVRSR